MDGGSVGLAGGRADNRNAAAWQARLRLYGAAGLLTHVLILFVGAVTGQWLVENGKPRAADFLSFWSAGCFALAGHAADAYDWALQKQAQVAAIGHDFPGLLPWLNPPTFLPFVTPFALLPYTVAWALWVGLTAGGFALALRLVLPGYLVPLMLAAPAALWCTGAGQNGFLTAALICGCLALLRRRPWLAGVLLGLLTCKPQFGLLFPLFLLVHRHWKSFGAAAGSTLALAAGTTLLFGLDPWQAFLNSIEGTNTILRAGGSDSTKLQSVYGLAFEISGDFAVSMAVHLGFAALLCLALVLSWRRRPAEAPLAAALAAASFLATPYVYGYDALILTVAAAFLVRDGLDRGFGRATIPLIVVALLLPATLPWTGAFASVSGGLLLFGLAVSRPKAGDTPTEPA